jgi:hypothetical protein
MFARSTPALLPSEPQNAQARLFSRLAELSAGDINLSARGIGNEHGIPKPV